MELESEVKVDGSRFFRVTLHLSPFGLSTRYGHPHPVGTRMQIGLYLPDEPKTPVRMEAEVVGLLTESAGMRLAFRHPSRDAVRRINHYLKVGLGHG